jgi:hypothetical protein
MQEALKAAALRLAAMGMRVFPLKPGEKTPAIDSWQKWASADPAFVERVWSKGAFNIGVAMGGGWVGLDIDRKHGKDGLVALAALGVEPAGFVVGTPSGGRHVYYRGPDLGNSAGRLGDGLDLRGVGGYLVGPGSVVEGGAYEVLAEGEIADCPAAIVQRSIAPRERGADQAPVVDADDPAAVARAVDYLRDVAEPAVEGQAGDLTAYKVANRVMDFGVSAETALALMAAHWNPRCSPPWDAEDLATKVRNAREYRLDPVGVAHPAADFDGVKVVTPSTPAVEPSRWYRHGDAFDADIPWLFHKILPQTGTGVLVATPGAGKTFLALEMARCGATSKPFMGVAPDDPFGTLFVFGGSEGSGFQARMAALQEPEALPISATVCGDLSQKAHVDQLIADLIAECEWVQAAHGVPVRLIVVETLAASGLLPDENDAGAASNAMRNLAHLGRRLGAFVLTSHHPAKDGKGPRGSSAIPGAADYVVEIDVHNKVREVRLTKGRNTAAGHALGSFTLLEVEVGRDRRNRPVVSMQVSQGEKLTKQVKAHAQTENLITAYEWALVEKGELVEGRQAVEYHTLLNGFGEKAGGSYERNPGNRRNAFKGAMDYLIEMGRFEEISFAGQVYYHMKEAIRGE